MSSGDKLLHCRECGMDFTFTAGEQAFYATRGFQNAPSRCPNCRHARRGQQSDTAAYTSTVRQAEARPTREMFSGTCAECGGPANVPFQPRNDKPVYCSDCYAKVHVNR